jgi:hypothetical protein
MIQLKPHSVQYSSYRTLSIPSFALIWQIMLKRYRDFGENVQFCMWSENFLYLPKFNIFLLHSFDKIVLHDVFMLMDTINKIRKVDQKKKLAILCQKSVF